jgi:hypothetical protein
MRIKVTKELRYRLKTDNVIGDLIVAVDHAVVCQSRCAELVFLPFFPPLLVHLSDEKG